MQAQTQIPVDITTVIQALIVLFVAAPPLVREIYHLRGRRNREGGQLPRRAMEAENGRCRTSREASTKIAGMLSSIAAAGAHHSDRRPAPIFATQLPPSRLRRPLRW